nr:transposase [Chloroflexota bacterium]
SHEFPGATCYVGTPFNDASRTMHGVWAQQVSQASNGKIIRQFDYKTSGAIQVDERYSSQTCPRCGARNKCRRVYRCRECGIVAPRDVVGSTNILCIGQHGAMRIGQSLATEVVYVRPVKVFRRKPDSSLGHSGHSSA